MPLNLLGNVFSAGMDMMNGQMQREWAERMWNKQNEYNSPAAQIARLKAAGMNPAAMGSGAGGTAAAMPSPESAGTFVKAPKLDFRALKSAQQDEAIKDQQITNIEKQGKMIDAQIASVLEDARGKKLNNDKLEDAKNRGRWQRDYDLQDAQIDKIKEERNKIMAEITSIKDANARAQKVEERLQEQHKEWQNNVVMRQALYEAEASLKLQIMSNDAIMQEARKKMLEKGFDPNDVKEGRLTYAELSLVIDAIMSTEKIMLMRHDDKLASVKKLLMPLTAAPIVGDAVETIVDMLDSRSPSWY